MAKITNFSKTQDILDNNDWELLRIVNERSETSRLIADKLRSIVTRLLSKSAGQYNIDDFVFLLTDEDQSNAFYMSNEHTKNGKNIISVSSQLIELCQSEDEMAGVIGHELGHFIYDKLSKNGKNTVFQERGSDLHSVDLLIDGDYDPVAYENIASRLFLRGKSGILKSLGVHGSDYARVEDVRAYLTYLKKERGEFKQTREVESWQSFKKQFNDKFKNDRYQSYLDQVMFEKLGTNIITPDNLVAVLDLYMAEIGADNVLNVARMFDTEQKLETYTEQHKNTNVSDAVLQKTQKITDLLLGHVRKVAKDVFYTEQVGVKIAQKLRWVRGYKYFEPRDEFKDFIDDMKAFINAKDIETADEIAKRRMGEVENFKLFKNLFDLPRFEMPEQSMAVGAEIPYYKHREWAKKNDTLARYLDHVFRITNNQFTANNTITDTKWPDDKWYELVDENGVITLVGQDALDYKIKMGNESSHRQWLEKISENEERFNKRLTVLNALSDFDNGLLSAAEFWDVFYKTYAQRSPDRMDDPMHYILSGVYDTIVNNPNDAQMHQKVLDSRAYKSFGQMNDKLELALSGTREYFERYNKDISVDAVAIDSTFRLATNENYLRRVNDALLKLSRETIPLKDSTNAYLYKSLYKEMQFGISGKIYENGSDHTDQLSKSIGPVREEVLDKIRFEFTKNMNEFIMNNVFISNDLGIMQITNEEIRNNKPTPLLDMTLEKLGLHITKDANEFYKNIKYVEEKIKNLGTLPLVLGYYTYKHLENDGDIKNLDTFLKNIIVPFMSAKSFEMDALAKYINRHNMIPDDLTILFRIYNSMELRGWFSENESNQTVFLDKLVNKISMLDRNKREIYSFMLLAGIYGTTASRRRDESMAFPDHKNRLMDILTDAILERIGRDDGSPEYEKNIQKIIDFIDRKLPGKSMVRGPLTPVYNNIDEMSDMFDIEYKRDTVQESLLNKTDKAKFYRLLSDKIVSQEKTSQLLGEGRVVSINDKDAQKHDTKARAFEGTLAFLEERPERATATIEFLNRRLTPESIEQFRQDINSDTISRETQDKYLTRQMLEIMYKTFWAEDLGLRSFIMNKLLNRHSSDVAEQIKYVCNMHFPPNDKFRADAELIFETAIMAFEPFERSLILSAIASADENKDASHQSASSSVGSGLRMFFENMGPAWVKFGQLLSYVPELPSEIREELAKLKDKADIPSRWELFESIKNTLPNELLANIVQVDEVLGAGSFWVTAKIQYVNKKTGKIQDKVLSLLRPHALERSRAGFKTIETAVKNLATKDKKYKSLLKVAQQAKASAEYEVDVVYGNKQFEKAEKLYSDLAIRIDGEKFTPYVARWEYYGVGKDSVGYKLMDMANGKTLSRVDADKEEKRKMALAYVTIELANLFKGDVWDIDRHMGQQNFEKTKNGYNINIYDTGAQIPKAPDKKDKVLLAEVLYGIIRAARTGKSLDQQILKTIKNMEKLESYFKVDTSYIADIQKGLLALSDIMEYQKEIKDKDGNIIQERLTLSAEDLGNAVEAVYQSDSTDQVIKVGLAGKIFMNKLRPLRRGWASSLTEGLKKNAINPIVVENIPRIKYSRSVQMNKPQSEIVDIENDIAAENILGVNKKYIKENPDMPLDILMQNKLREIA